MASTPRTLFYSGIVQTQTTPDGEVLGGTKYQFKVQQLDPNGPAKPLNKYKFIGKRFYDKLNTDPFPAKILK